MQPQHNDHIAVGESGAHVVKYFHAHLFDAYRQQSLRRDHAHFGYAQRGERMDLRTCDARMQYIADNGDGEIVKRALVAAYREHVQQALCRMRVAAVAGVHHRDVVRHMARNQMRRAALRMTYNEHVGMHRSQIVDRVQYRFTLALARGGDIQIDDVGGQSLGGDFKRRAGTRGGFEE